MMYLSLSAFTIYFSSINPVFFFFFFFSSRRRHTRFSRDWSSDVCSSDLVVDRIHDDLHERAHDLSSARRAAHEERAVVAEDDRRRAGPEHALTGGDRIWPTRTRIEPVHPVGHHDPGALRHDRGAEAAAELGCERNEHTVLVDGVHVRRVWQVGHRAEPLLEGLAQSDGDAVKALGASLRVRAEVLAVEGLQRVRYGRAAGEARQRQDTVLAIAERLRGPLGRLVGREVLAGQDAAQGANVLDDRRAKLTLVERARSVASQRLERAREIGLLQTLRRLEAGRRPIGWAAGPVVHTLRLGIAVQPCRVRAEDERPVPIHHEAVVRETDGGIEQPRPGELSVPAVRELVRGDGSWDAEREGPFDVRVTFHRRPAVHPGACVATRELE